MTKIITSQVVIAYSQCHRKAFLLLHSEGNAVPHEYICLLEERARLKRNNYLDVLKQKHPFVTSASTMDLLDGKDILFEVPLKFANLEASADVLTRVPIQTSRDSHIYEPTIIVGTHHITKDQKLELLFVGYVVGQLQGKLPSTGKIVGADGQVHEVALKTADKTLIPIIDSLRQWTASSPSDPPPVILNKHCPSCQFRQQCLEQAERTDDLSLLDRITPKNIRQYQKKGIFTITQLSYSFRPRRSRKHRARPKTHFKAELQALAIRTGKIYIQELPILSRCPVELFLDIEGIPDQNFHYLIGLLINEKGNASYYSFWANDCQGEQRIWNDILEKIDEYPEAPIFHYGSYEPRAIDEFAQRYETNCDAFKNRLINLNSGIYGKVYFPTRSNSLKELGKFVGASWASPDASGLQSLVWRHRWDETGDSRYKELLINYNREDCHALWLLTEQLSKIIETADSHLGIDFADRPKQNSTEIGSQIHEQFEKIIRYAHADYNKKRVTIRPESFTTDTKEKMKGPPKGHQAYRRIAPSNAKIVIEMAPKRICPLDKGKALVKSEKLAEKFIVNLHFTKNGCRKTITKYVGPLGYCRKCGKYYKPPKFAELGKQMFGHAFQAWTIYQRIILRLPYDVILQAMEDMFNERVSVGTLINFIRYFAEYYAATEELSVRHILESPFVHVDETKINIQGINNYVWVFTDGQYVIFRMTETRETTIVHEFLSDYKGILISDFYGGYDSVACRQQKCLVHLIRDLNDDLWSDPYNLEYEFFVSEVKNLLMPIFQAVQKYGLKKRYLGKFIKSVAQFYKKNIDCTPSSCQLVSKYQKRFQRYRESLFTFLELDYISWHNNTAENAIRHLAVQRKISGSFFKRVATQYLLLLGIAQTCKFQDKSLLKFFLSEEKDIDKFRASQIV